MRDKGRGLALLMAVAMAQGSPASGWSGGFAAEASEPFEVPEPASWAMLVTGFALIGTAIRRGRVRGRMPERR